MPAISRPGDDAHPAYPPREAAVKAFMTTRIADVFMMLGIVFFWRAFRHAELPRSV